MYPIIPHFAEIIYNEYLYKTNIIDHETNPEYISFHKMPRVY